MVAGSRLAGPRAVAWRRALALAVAVVAVDQATKAWLRSSLAVGDESRVVPGLLKLVHVRNHGVAFGFLSGGGAIVLLFTFAALAGLGAFLTLRPRRRGLWIPTGLLAGGAIGNLLDRLDSGAVTDFVKLPAWPAFNAADVAITFGVLSLLYVLDGSGPRGHTGA